MTPSTFADLGVHDDIVAALLEDGIETAFPIQEQTLPLGLDGQDLIGQAKTGTGKTLAFGIPLLMSVGTEGRTPRALVIVPTRELAIQVAGDLANAGRRLGTRVAVLYGGRAYEPQIDLLQKGVDVVVGTPGRVLDLIRQRHLDIGDVRVLVLDEADEMLDLGFLPDVEAIVAKVPTTRQTLLFSATMPGSIINLARRYMTQPTHIRATQPDDDSAIVDTIEQHVWRAHSLDKQELIARALQAEGRGLTIVFCRTKRNASRVADDLVDRGFAAATIHGDLGQGAREQALRAFRSGKVDVLVATDVAARGIDVADVTHVINWECPEDEKTYLHRIGRTGRAGKGGVALTLVDWDDVHRWQMINRALGLAFVDPVETYSTSPHVYTGLGIPTHSTGRLPEADRTREGLKAERLEDLGGSKPRERKGSAPQRNTPSTHRSKPTDKPATKQSPTQSPKQRSGAPKDSGTRSGGNSKDGAKRTRNRTRRRTPNTSSPAADTSAP